METQIKLKFFQNKKVLLYPYTQITKVLSIYLKKNGCEVLGFIDKVKNGKNIYKIDTIAKDLEYDYVLIFSPNHFKSIYQDAIKYIKKEKIFFVSIDTQTTEYIFDNHIDKAVVRALSKKEKFEKYFEFKKQNYTLENKILLIGIDFIDLNIKYLYLYLKKYTNLPVYLATDSKRDKKILENEGLNVVNYFSQEFIDLVFECKIKVIDHTPADKLLIECLKIGKSIQLWHGITVKMLGLLANYKALRYDCVLSTSDFVTKYSFSKLYDTKSFCNCGYPRNDILHFDNIELINTDKKLLSQMKDDNYRYIVYMPTYRMHGFANNPIDYEKLNKFCKKYKLKFIIKMHPFIAQKLRDDLNNHQTSKQLENIIIFEPYKDIYPILRYTDLMVADYSSVYFDYLFVGKPIVFFNYDYAKWVETQKGTMLNYFEYSPGDKVNNFDALLKKIVDNLKEDKYKEERKKIKDKMFENQNIMASKCITEKIIGMFK